MINVNIKSVHFHARGSLDSFIREHLAKLETFWGQVKRADVTLAVVRESGHHDNKVVELKVDVPHNPIFAKSIANNFEKAVVQAIEKVKRQLTKGKEKAYDHNVDLTDINKEELEDEY